MLCTRVLAQWEEELVEPQEGHREAGLAARLVGTVLPVQKVGTVRLLTVGNFEAFHTQFDQYPVLEEMPGLAESRLLGASPA